MQAGVHSRAKPALASDHSMQRAQRAQRTLRPCKHPSFHSTSAHHSSASATLQLTRSASKPEAAVALNGMGDASPGLLPDISRLQGRGMCHTSGQQA